MKKQSVVESIYIPNSDHQNFYSDDTEDTEELSEGEEVTKSTEEPKKKRKQLERKNFVKHEVQDFRVHLLKRQASGMWEVRKSTSSKATKLFETKEEAEEYAKSLIKNSNAEIIIHN